MKTEMQALADALETMHKLGRNGDDEAVSFSDPRSIAADKDVASAFTTLLTKSFGLPVYLVSQSLGSTYCEIELPSGNCLTVRASEHANTSRLHSQPVANFVYGCYDWQAEIDNIAAAIAEDAEIAEAE